MKLPPRLIFWVIVYVLMILVPIGLAFLPPLPPARGFWIEFGVGLGFVGLAMMGLQFALTARFRWIAGEIGLDGMLQFHRQAGVVAFGFVIAHPIVLILASRDYLAFFDPSVNLPRALALSVAIVALILVVALTLWRKTLRIPYVWWRLTHGLLALTVIFVGLAHTLMVGHYVSVMWKQGMWILLIGASMALLMQTRLLKPLLAARRPWRVESVRREMDRLWTLTLAPDGHDGLRFRAGQCVWLTIADRPLALEQHPFTVSSSAEQPGRVSFTIKELGDYTSQIGTTPVGARAYLEGPYGTFTLPADASGPLLMFAGGIGITPFLSMLRTMRDRGQRSRAMLVYAASGIEDLAFREELAGYEQSLGLRLVLLPEAPPDGWTGESGLLTEEMLDRFLQEYETPDTRYFVCGPEPMMDLVETKLLTGGVPIGRVNSERFNIA